MGVGHELRGDDAFGPMVARQLAANSPPTALVLDTGSAPENFTGVVRRHKPEVLLVLDAADFGGRVGELRLLKAEAVSTGGFFTHAASLRLLFDYLRAECGTEGVVLAVQAGTVEFSGPMSTPVAEAAGRAAALLTRALAERSGRA